MSTSEILPLRGTMVHTATVTVRTFKDSAESAAYFTTIGLWTVPVIHGGKKPIGDDWEKQRIDAANLPNYYNGQPQNVGGLLGISSLGNFGFTDVDLDSSEALALAKAFLPETGMIFGRASKPASHHCYFTDPPVRLEQFRDPLNKKSMLLELRGLKKTDGESGLQTVLPGSAHPSGEPITFEPGHDSAPTSVPPAELIRAFTNMPPQRCLSDTGPTMAATIRCWPWPVPWRALVGHGKMRGPFAARSTKQYPHTILTP
jgi:hypothetical protein